MELACTSPWKTVISIYKDLHTSGFLFGALCWKAPFPWNLQPHHHCDVHGLDSPEPTGLVVNQQCPTSASPSLSSPQALDSQQIPAPVFGQARLARLCLDPHVCPHHTKKAVYVLQVSVGSWIWKPGISRRTKPPDLICRHSSHSHLPGTQIKGNLVRPRELLLQDLAHEGGQSLVPRSVSGFRQVISLLPIQFPPQWQSGACNIK